MPRTFAELETADQVDPQEVVATLDGYADEGSVIGSNVVDILRRATFSRTQLEALLSTAEKGRVTMAARVSEHVNFGKRADEYQAVRDFVRNLLEGLDTK